MAFNYFYKQFETIRIIIRRLYLYGCYSRDDFECLHKRGKKKYVKCSKGTYAVGRYE